MRFGASRSSGAVAIPDLRLRWGLFAATSGGVAVIAGMLLTQPPDAAELARECRVISEVAPVLGEWAVVPEVGGKARSRVLDCRTSLMAAGVTIAPSVVETDGHPYGPVVVFERPRLPSVDRVIVQYGVVCGSLCGQGYRAELVRRNGRWEVVARSRTWIA